MSCRAVITKQYNVIAGTGKMTTILCIRRMPGCPRSPSFLICHCGNKKVVSAALPRRMSPVSRAIIIMIITIMRKSLFIVVIIIVVNIFSPFSAIVEFRHGGTLRRTCTGNGHEVSACRGPGW